MQLIKTERLILRKWHEADHASFINMNRDPIVMQYFPKLYKAEESLWLIEKSNKQIDELGYGLFACEIAETKIFIGFVGLNVPSFQSHFTPCVEIGWRLASPYWGKGYATEAAQEVLNLGFKNFNLKEIVSFTVPQNQSLRRVMTKIGMKQDLNGSFYHPNLPRNHPFSLHVLYRIQNTTI